MIQAALVLTALPGMFIQTVEMRTEVTTLLSQDRYIDLRCAGAQDPAEHTDSDYGPYRRALRDIRQPTLETSTFM
jgi:hypothetical protein